MSGTGGHGWGPPVGGDEFGRPGPMPPRAAEPGPMPPRAAEPGSVACWPDGALGPYAFNLAPPTPSAPREGVAYAWREGVELHGTSFAVLHGRSSHDPAALRRYAAAVLAAADMIERGAG